MESLNNAAAPPLSLTFSTGLDAPTVTVGAAQPAPHVAPIAPSAASGASSPAAPFAPAAGHATSAGAGGVALAADGGDKLVVAPRNKGIICKNYFATQHCAVGNCPYAHVADNESRPLPDSVCMFFAQNACLRDNCRFFHGTKSQLRMLKESGAAAYRPQDFMLVRNPMVPQSSIEAPPLPMMPPPPPPRAAPLMAGGAPVGHHHHQHHHGATTATLGLLPGGLSLVPQPAGPGPMAIMGMQQPLFVAQQPQPQPQQMLAPQFYFVPQQQPGQPGAPPQQVQHVQHVQPHMQQVQQVQQPPRGQPVLMAVTQPDGSMTYQYVLLQQ